MSYLVLIQEIREVMTTLFITGLTFIVWSVIGIACFIIFSKPGKEVGHD